MSTSNRLWATLAVAALAGGGCDGRRDALPGGSDEARSAPGAPDPAIAAELPDAADPTDVADSTDAAGRVDPAWSRRGPGRPLRFRAAASMLTPHGFGALGAQPIAATTGDVDGDGRAELIATYSLPFGAYALSTFFVDAHGTPAARFDTDAPGASGPIAAGDFDGDGLSDAAVIDARGDRVDIYLSRNDGRAFIAAAPIVVADGVLVALAAGDLDGDGRDDLVLSDASGSLVIELATGGGAFRRGDRRGLGARPDAVILADLDGNHTLDIATVVAPDVAVLLNDGHARFAKARRFTVGGTAGPLVAADVDGDGDRDLLLSPGGVGLSILFNDGAAGFAPGRPQPALAATQLLFAGDLDRDGTDDVYAGHDRAVTILYGRCHDGVRVGPTYSAAPLLAAGDLAGDRRIDVAALAAPFAGPDGPGFVAALVAQHDGTLWAARLFAQPERAVAAGDFDHSGRESLLLVAPDHFDLWTARAIFSGRPPMLAAVASEPLGSAVVGHFDHDGTLDFAFGEAAGIQVELGNGRGRFRPGALDTSSTELDARGRFTSRHADDLVIDHGRAILPSDGHGGFGPPVSTGLPGGVALAVGDFDGDGHDDLAAGGGPFVYVVLGHGDGTFSAPIETHFAGAYRVNGLWSGDFDDDGRDDLVVAAFLVGPDGEDVYVLRSSGDGRFGEQLGATGTGFYTMHVVAAVADFNHDGVADLAVGMHGRVDVLAGHRGTTMTRDDSYRIDGDPSAIFAGDLDGDWRRDLELAVDEGVVWLRNVTR